MPLRPLRKQTLVLFGAAQSVTRLRQYGKQNRTVNIENKVFNAMNECGLSP